jgi:hypothetical protein
MEIIAQDRLFLNLLRLFLDAALVQSVHFVRVLLGVLRRRPLEVAAGPFLV